MRYRRRSAYYGRNDSYSRSYNAEVAEEEGRYPLTRAAKVLGLSVDAFRRGCAAAEYRPTEWHHVGKFAARVDYYDTNELSDNAQFWRGAAEAYKSRKRSALLAVANEIETREPAAAN